MSEFQDPRPGEIVVRTSPQMLEETFAALRPLLATAEARGYDTSRVYLLLDELMSNIYRHGYLEAQGEPIGVRLRVDDGSVLIAMRDRAFTFDVAAHASTRRAPPRKRGSAAAWGSSSCTACASPS